MITTPLTHLMSGGVYYAKHLPRALETGISAEDLPHLRKAGHYNKLTLGIMAAAAGMVYDLAHDGQAVPHNDLGKARTVLAAARLMTMVDIADDRVDQYPMTIEERSHYIQSNLRAGTEPDVPIFSEFERSNDSHFRASFALARQLYHAFLYRDDNRVVAALTQQIVDADTAQLSEHNPAGLLRLAEEMGGASLELLAALVEIQDGVAYPAVRAALRSYGAAGQIIDNLSDIDRDLTEGVNTFATERVLREGDTPRTRKRMADEMITRAESLVTEGSNGLNPSQTKLYAAMRKLGMSKYRIYGPVRKAQRKVKALTVAGKEHLEPFKNNRPRVTRAQP